MAKSLHDQPPTEENIKQILGYPDIVVDPLSREQQCTNCGISGHSRSECSIPNMEGLLERFGMNCYDASPASVEAKKRIVADLCG
jgi:hypothetical protein